MNYKNGLLIGAIVALVIALTVPTGWSRQEGRGQEKKTNVGLPAAVAKAVKANFPDAEIGSAEVEKEAGINLYDIEFKADKGEIEVAEDGTVLDVATIVAMTDVPKAAAEAISKAAHGATIKQLEKSEIRAEIKKEGEKGTLLKLEHPKYVYEAELSKGNQSGEIQVAPDGKIVEALKWSTKVAKKQGEEEEAKEGKEGMVDLKILPDAVLSAFKAAYPEAVIKGASKETEKGTTYYEVESVDGKLNRDLLYTADGKAVEIEESIAAKDLPAAVQKTLAEDYPGAKVLKAERMSKGNQILFELRIQIKDKQMGVTIDPNGKILGKNGSPGEG